MSRNAPRLALAALVTIAGCLTPPPLPPRRDAGLRDGSDPDSPAAPFRVESVAVLDARGEPWDSSAAPRAPSIVVTFSDPLASPSDCLLLRGRLDAETIEDLTALPLRGATAELRAAVLTNASGASVMIAPEAPLAPGDVFTLAIGAWASREDGTRLGAPFTHELVVSTDPRAGARMTDAWPPDGAFAVPVALALAAIRLDGDVESPASAIVLRGPSGASVEGVTRTIACSDIGWPEGTCVTLEPAGPLEPDTTHTLGIGEGTRDATGAPVPHANASFVTGSGPPPAPLGLAPIVCGGDEIASDGGCALIDDASIAFHFLFDGAARIAWHGGSRVGWGIAPRGDFRIAVDELGPRTNVTFGVVATDYVGRSSELRFQYATTEPLPTLSITEVRADPAGAEPRQEYVELENYGTAPVDLAGTFLSDSDSEGDALPALVVMPGARVLLVTDDFDPDERAGGGDAAVPPGTMLARITGTLASGGLSNSGEPVFLRDAMRRRLSAAPASPPPIEGVCIVRIAASPRTGMPGSFGYDSRGTCTPGR